MIEKNLKDDGITVKQDSMGNRVITASKTSYGKVIGIVAVVVAIGLFIVMCH